MVDNLERKARWTTADEFTFLHQLYDNRNRHGMAVYVRLAKVRDWTGDGISVDADAVIAEAQRLLGLIESESPEELA